VPNEAAALLAIAYLAFHIGCSIAAVFYPT
jgi:hypothetical protein